MQPGQQLARFYTGVQRNEGEAAVFETKLKDAESWTKPEETDYSPEFPELIAGHDKSLTIW
jgi:hypothetical protein